MSRADAQLAKRMLRRPSATIVEIGTPSGGSSTPAWSWLSDRTASMAKDSAKEEEALAYACKIGVPSMSAAQIDLGLAMMRQGRHRFEDAKEALQRAVAEDSSSIKAYRTLAYLLGEMGHFNEVEWTVNPNPNSSKSLRFPTCRPNRLSDGR